MHVRYILFVLLSLSTPAAPTLSAQSSVVRDGRTLVGTGGFLGVAIIDIDSDRLARLKLNEERGVEVTFVQETGPADAAGIKPGDVLLTFNGETILGAQQFVRLVHETPPARRVRLTYWRSGREQSTTVLTAAPQAFEQGRLLEEDTRFGVPFSTLGSYPDFPGIGMPDVPAILMIWTNLATGIVCEPVDAQLAEYFGVKQGVLVRSVAQGSAAAKAGFRAGDVLTAVGNHPVRTPDEFRRLFKASGKFVAISLLRNHKQLTLQMPVPHEQE